ncbi:MAG: HD-GYP domain-containing protein [Clostridiales bacterium]|nr:HD-GYP domain-containing protein [Clostridiales bacterium]
MSAEQTTAFSVKQLARVSELLARVHAARRAAQFYPLDHPAVTDGVDALAEVIERFHDEGVDVVFSLYEGEILFHEQQLPQESIVFDQLIREITALGIGVIEIERGCTRAELAAAISILAADSHAVEQHGGIERMAAETGLSRVRFGQVRAFERVEQGEFDEKAARDSYVGAVDLVREIDDIVRRNRAIGCGRIKSVVRGLVDNVIASREAMLELTGLKSHDEYTFYHSANVAILSLALGSAITSDYRFLSSLGAGALLHDLGKMTVDLEILNKPGALTPDEWAAVRNHSVSGARTASRIRGLDKSAIVIILEHHMRYDGLGYPSRTSRRPQHLASRIVAVADAYDAMTSRRAYSAARVHDEAMELLVRSADTALDPALVRLFVTIMGVYPPRSVVRLNDGSTAVVLRPNRGNPLRPVVNLIADGSGAMLADPVVIDLGVVGGLDVVRCLDTADLNIDVEGYVV